MNWKKVESYVRKGLSKDKTGHDYGHVERVTKTAMQIAKKYKIDKDVLKAACLLHDISYKKGITKKHHIESAKQARPLLKRLGFSKNKIEHIQEVIIHHVGHMEKSARGRLSTEAKILRDADNIDALGSIGIIRMIQFSLKQEIPYFTSKKDKLNQSFYGNLKFLLSWPDKMLTKEGKSIGKKRVKIIKSFLKQIEKEF